MSRKESFEEGSESDSGKVNPLSFALEAARHEHARHFGVDVNTVKFAKPVTTNAEPPFDVFHLPDVFSSEFKSNPTHMTVLAHPDPQTGKMKKTAWNVYAGKEQRPVPSKLDDLEQDPKKTIWAYNSEMEDKDEF